MKVYQIGFEKVFNISYEDYEPCGLKMNFSAVCYDFFAKRPGIHQTR